MNRQWRNAALAAVAAGLWLALAAPAFADDPCAGDIQSLCQGIPAGGARIYYCLKSNWNNLSDGCKATFDQANQLAREVSLDCQADVFSWCQGVPPGQGRILSCLISHYDDLSSGCVDGLAKLRQFQDACSADAAALCAGMPVGEGRVVACLLAQKSQLSPACRSVLRPRDQ